VPGCIATGPTVDEVVEDMSEALAFHFEGLRREGLPIPAAATRAAVVEAA
jgi:predicted RNase H-like HicB family nuclease